MAQSKFNCLLYGPSGVGKTPLAATLEHCELTSPCLFIDIEAGTLSIKKEPLPTIVTVEKWSTLDKIYQLLETSNWHALAELTGRDAEYKSVVIDSGTELEYMLRSKFVSEDNNNDGIPAQPHYLKTQERFRRAFRKFRNLPVTFVMVAGIRELKDDASGIIKRHPDFQPSLCTDLMRMTDVLLYMSVKHIREKDQWLRTLQAAVSSRVIARDRSCRLDPITEAEVFSFDDIARKVLS